MIKPVVDAADIIDHTDLCKRLRKDHPSYWHMMTAADAIDSTNAKITRLCEALQMLHDETADYVRLNNLGDPWHNQSMKLARAALAECK